MIYTSYHAKVTALRTMAIVPINISRFAPRFVKAPYVSYKALAPTPEMLKMGDEEYKVAFAELLSKLDPQKVADELLAIGKGHPVAICCYEKPGDFCHRHLVADWLNQYTDLKVDEITFTAPTKEEKELAKKQNDNKGETSTQLDFFRGSQLKMF